MAKILVVDDSQFDRTLIQGILQSDRELEVFFATNGIEAMRMIEKLQPDLVVTDLMMPEMDGLQIVQSVRQDYAWVPVIVITAVGSEANAFEALRQGATSFVPKLRLADRLANTIHQVLALNKPAHRFHQIVGSLSRATLAFELQNDIKLIPIFVQLIQTSLSSTSFCDATEAIRLSMAVEEALLNALIHGNLELSEDVSREGIRPQSKAFQQRSQQAPYSQRSIFVEVELSEQQFVCVIRDEGPGFDPRGLPAAESISSLRDGVGRGIILMRLFMDHVEFSSCGNQVRLVRDFCQPASSSDPLRPISGKQGDPDV